MPGYDQDFDDDEENKTAETEVKDAYEPEVIDDSAEATNPYEPEVVDDEAANAHEPESDAGDDDYNTALPAEDETKVSPSQIPAEQQASDQSPSKPTSQQLLAAKGFTFVKTLRPGGISGGSLDLYSYKGDDQEVKNLLHDGELLLKTELDADADKEPDKKIKQRITHGKMTFQNEFENIASLLAQNNGDADLKRPKMLAMEFGGKKFIFNECIYQDPAAKIAANLQDHMESMYQVDAVFIYESLDAKGMQTRKDQRTAELDKIFENIVSAQNQLHDRQLLHLDSAGRNYCMLPDGGLKVIDFGASLKMNLEGCIDGSRPYTQIPTSFFDQRGLLPPTQGKTSIETDLFARRMTMMETMAIYMGFNTDGLRQGEIYYKGLPGYPTTQHMQLFLRGIDNDIRLNNVFNNLMAEAVLLQQAGDVRGDVIIEQLNKYKPYLTSMPQFTSLAQMRTDESRAFTDCVSLNKEVQRLTSILENPAELEKVKSDPLQLRQFAHDLNACVAECQKKGVPEKLSTSSTYQQFAETKERLQARNAEPKVELKVEPPSDAPSAKM